MNIHLLKQFFQTEIELRFVFFCFGFHLILAIALIQQLYFRQDQKDETTEGLENGKREAENPFLRFEKFVMEQKTFSKDHFLSKLNLAQDSNKFQNRNLEELVPQKKILRLQY